MAAGKALAFLSRVVLPVGALVTLFVFAYGPLGFTAVGIGAVAAAFTVGYLAFIKRRYTRKRRPKSPP